MKVWVYLDGRQQGPFEKEQLRELPGFNENTKVWFEGLPKWLPANTLDEFAGYFGEESASEPSPEKTDTCDPDDMSDKSGAREFFSRYAPGRSYMRPTSTTTPDEPCPPTYIGLSIILLICCCSPFSIGALAASIFVSSYYGHGDIKKAKKASEIAAWLIMIAIALGFLPVMYLSAILG